MATFSQNVGIVTTTKVINRCVLGLAVLILGVTVSVFASIAMTGMKIVASAEMDYRYFFIVGLAATLGVGVSQATEVLVTFPGWVTMIFGKSPVVLATIIAVL